MTLIVSLSVSTAFADGWKNENGKGKDGNFLPPGLAKKIFDDTDKFPWAVQAIEKMFLKGLIKGYGNGVYNPQGTVTKLEAIIMSLRVMGWEEEALEINELPEKYKGKSIDGWAVGYVSLAYNKGILDDVDMMYFKANDPALRHEVAKYVIRALGYEEEAQDNMDEELDFVDEMAVPQGSIGYVYLVDEMDLMTGDTQDRFNPMGTMTRAEMAVLFSRLDDKVDSDVDDNEVIGEVARMTEDTMTLRINNSFKFFDISEEVRVYKGRDRVRYDEIKIGDRVKLELEDGEVEYIEILDSDNDDKIITKYSGVVKEIETGSSKRIAIQVKTMVMMFEVIKDVEVTFENGEGSFDEIEEDDEVTVTVDNKNRAREIHVHRNRVGHGWDEEAEGIITNLDLSGTYHISIDGDRYVLDQDAEVEINDDDADLDELVVGMEAIIMLEDGVVKYIEAEDNKFEVEGEIEAITLTSAGYKLSITVSEEVYDYMVSEDVEIEIDDEDDEDEDAEINDLEVGQEGEFEIVNNVIVKINIED